MPEYQDAKTNFFLRVYLYQGFGSDCAGCCGDLLGTGTRPTGFDAGRTAGAGFKRGAGFFSGFDTREARR
jgi:hypothetical protein